MAVADVGIGQPRSLGIIRSDHDALRALLKKLGRPSQLRVCYEAGPCGYVVYRFLERQRVTRLEHEIEACTRTSAHAPTVAALQAMRGIKLVTAATIVSELGDISRFSSPRELMSYAGMVPSERSSGKSIRRGSITKTGNAHLRRVFVETAWHYRHQPGISDNLRKRQRDVPAQACSIAWNAQQRLNKRYRHLVARGKTSHQSVVAVGRELLGFIWAIATTMKTLQAT